MKEHRPAFTLIELLVVLTIIVVLLALLAPALNRAIYQAELAVCAARQGTVSIGAQTAGANEGDLDGSVEWVDWGDGARIVPRVVSSGHYTYW